MKLVETDNFDGDYPDEKFVTPMPRLSLREAAEVCDIFNSQLSETGPRYYKIVEDDYVLQPGFQP